MVHTKKGCLEDYLYLTGWIFLVLGLTGSLLYLKAIVPILENTEYTCIVYRLFGIYCPGCGGTRALSALLQGHFLVSAWYHPLVIYTIIIFGGFMISQTLARLHFGRVKGWRFHEWHLYAAVAIMIGNFILKNILLLGFHISL